MANIAPALPIDLTKTAILLDVDGTILDIAPRPGDVHAPANLRATLARLVERTSGATALVSGRSIGDLDRIFAPVRLPAIGGHGAELRPSGREQARRSPRAELSSELKRLLHAIGDARPGIIVEDKGYAVALHYRLAPEQEPVIRDAVAAIRSQLPPDIIEVIPGKAVFEVKPAGFNKGTALRELMAFPAFAGRRPIFIGDDTTDETAFAAMPEFHGVPISVGRAVTGVSNRFETPRDVRDWLEKISNGAGMAA
jgi:trehalose 6-phosphate phosphatase